MARVKKILQADDEIAPVSQNAAFVITLATVCRSTVRSSSYSTLLTSAGNVHPIFLRTSSQPGEDRHQAQAQHPIQRLWYMIMSWLHLITY